MLEMFSYDFMVRAIVVGALVSLCAALLGVILVLKRYSMIGDGLSHVAFGATALAMVLSVADMYLMLPITILVSILLVRLTNKGKVKNDSAIAMLSVGAMAIGYLLVNIFAPTPITIPSGFASMAHDATAFAKPVMGTSVPPPENLAIFS